MKRIERKSWTNEQLGIVQHGGGFDVFDNFVKEYSRMTDAEYDLFCEITTDEEMDLLVKENPTFTDKRNLIILLEEKIYGKA